ncbi:CvpA family protein [Vulcaniibacterium tengchongense]|uniref:Membrane protein required for colicin V production n=1 Tax=Vulcaniibacterium tengchongense TaxID=1273429 RepID=A0A3N4VW44_9GAMM|nr:CvpA family protein [Vulcaniibacterium tengchongense]RPE77284.1 membrane protein required for colicin V production [Vulcaniibacterium tengchongense]
MTGLDWVLLAIVALSALLGLMRGFVGVVLSLLSWLLAGAAAYWFGGEAATLLSGDAAPGFGHVAAGYLLSFAAVMAAVMLLSWFIRRLLATVGLSGVDRGLGLLLGLVRGALLACVLVLLLGFTSLPAGPQWQRAQVVPVFEPGARWLGGLLPEGLARQVDFDAGGPISREAWREQERRLDAAARLGGAGDAQALLRSLGEPQAQDTGAAGPAGRAAEASRELHVDGPIAPDSAAVDGPAPRPREP